MKSILFSLLLLCASPCFAAYLPTIPYDGNGNTPGVVQDASGNFLIDSGARTATMTNSNGNALGVDLSTRTLQTIDYAHHEIHAGSHFNIVGATTMAAGETIVFSLTTPSNGKQVHILYGFSSTGACTVSEYQGAVVTGGETLVIHNNNHNYADTLSGSVAHYRRTVSSFGTMRAAMAWGSAGRPQTGPIGGGDGRENELVLLENTTYILVLQSSTAANIVTYAAEWYEHTPKTN